MRQLVTLSSDMMQYVVYIISLLTYSNCKFLILTQDLRAVSKILQKKTEKKKMIL